MANYRISSTGAVGTLQSVVTSIGSAFVLDSAVADTLTVDAGAFLISNDLAADTAGASLANTGAWSVAVSGIVIGTNGIVLAAGNSAASSITVNKDASVTGASNHGIVARSSVAIKNAGSIVGAANAISIEGGAGSSIANTGSIIGTNYAIFDFSGISNDAVLNSGLISGNVDVAGGTNSLTNSGSITGRVVGGAGNDSFTNTKTISGYVDLGAGTNTLNNSGSIGADGAGVSVRGGTIGTDSVTNSGTLSASIALLDGTNSVVNSGTVGMDAASRSYNGGSGADTVTNTAMLLGGVNMADGANTLINSGTVGKLTGTPGLEGVSYAGTFAADAITNSGRLLGAVNAGDGSNTVRNTGTIGVDDNGYSIIGGSGSDAITNAARISTKVGSGGTISGNVITGDGDDTLTNYVSFSYKAVKYSSALHKNVVILKTGGASGQINGVVDLGDGSDTVNGGAYVEKVKDGNGGDFYRLGGGDDLYIATGAAAGLDGYDFVDGGAGLLDSYDARAAISGGIVINLDTVAHAETNTGVGNTAALANRAYGTDIAGQPPSSLTAPYDTVTNFERVAGTQFGDVIFGSAFANELSGNAGDDHLWGFGGNDQLNGGAGADAIIGGTGADVLAGGTGDDTFWYLAVSDSGNTVATRDWIVDFTGGAGGDVIDLSNIDANSKITGNDAFNFVGTNVAWGGTAGELRAVWSGIGQFIEGDINGDKVADFSIFILDVAHTIELSNVNGVDFVL